MAAAPGNVQQRRFPGAPSARPLRAWSAIAAHACCSVAAALGLLFERRRPASPRAGARPASRSAAGAARLVASALAVRDRSAGALRDGRAARPRPLARRALRPGAPTGTGSRTATSASPTSPTPRAPADRARSTRAARPRALGAAEPRPERGAARRAPRRPRGAPAVQRPDRAPPRSAAAATRAAQHQRRAALRRRDGVFDGYWGVARDVTDEIRAPARLRRQRDALPRAVRALAVAAASAPPGRRLRRQPGGGAPVRLRRRRGDERHPHGATCIRAGESRQRVARAHRRSSSSCRSAKACRCATSTPAPSTAGRSACRRPACASTPPAARRPCRSCSTSPRAWPPRRRCAAPRRCCRTCSPPARTASR